MRKNITSFDLIRNLYKETTLTEKKAIGSALATDVELSEENGAIWDGYRQLPKVLFNPAPSTLQNILAYSAVTAVEQIH